MFAKSLLILASLHVIACSGEATPKDSAQGGAAGVSPAVTGTAGSSSASGASNAGGTGDAALIVPETMEVSANPGNNSIFGVVALTLRQTADGPQLYAAVKNQGDAAGCNVAFSVTLYDKDEQTVGAGISGLMVRHFYQRTDAAGSASLVGCVSAGEVTMVAITRLDTGDTPIESVRKVVYSSQYWSLENLVAIDGVTLEDVQAVTNANGVAYAGALVNHLDQPLSNPTVAVYPLNTVGRPLGVAYGAATLDVAPGANWNFETNTVSDAGVDFDAYPMGGS